MSTLRRTTAALALTLVAGAGLSGCNGDKPSAEPSSTPSSSTPTEESPSPSDAATVSSDDAVAYGQALTTMGKAFQQFSTDFTAAVKKRDDKAVIGTAATLRDAVVTFDQEVSALDLSAVQDEATRVLRDDQQIIDQLGVATKAKDGPAAIKKLNTIDFQEFTLAFTDLGQKIQAAQ
jgi:hypothetical protein